MALCSNATSLLEIAFGVNAVFGVFFSRLTDVRLRFSQIAISAFQKIDPDFNPTNEEYSYFEKWINRSLFAYKVIKFVVWIPAAMSFVFMVSIVGILYFAAILDQKCQIPDFTLLLMSVVSIFFAPAVYFAHEKLINFIISQVDKHTFKSADANKACIEMYKVCRDGQELLKYSNTLIYNYQLQKYSRYFRGIVYKIRHPINTFMQAYNSWKTEKLINEILKEDPHNKP